MNFNEFVDALQDCIDDYDEKYAPVADHQIGLSSEEYNGETYWEAKIPDFFGHIVYLNFYENDVYGEIVHEIDYSLYTFKNKEISRNSIRFRQYSEENAKKLFDELQVATHKAYKNVGNNYEKYL